MKIIFNKNYEKDYKKKIVNKHLYKEIKNIEVIKDIIIKSKTLNEVILNPLSKIYRIEKKTGDKKEFFTARINNKVRLIMKPVGKYPYNYIEIIEIEFLNIDDTHYGEG